MNFIVKNCIKLDARGKSVLIFSDTHLGKKVFPKKLEYLITLCKKYDIVIINGDFWDYFLLDFGDFLNSGWVKLFEVLKSRHTVYITGNHDYPEYVDGRVLQFCDDCAMKVEIITESNEYHIEHGDKYPDNKKLQLAMFKVLGRRISQLKYKFIGLLFRIFGGEVFLPGKIKGNTKQREAAKEREATLVFGHTHYPEHDEEIGWINGGFIDHGHASYVVIDKHGKAELKKERY